MLTKVFDYIKYECNDDAMPAELLLSPFVGEMYSDALQELKPFYDMSLKQRGRELNPDNFFIEDYPQKLERTVRILNSYFKWQGKKIDASSLRTAISPYKIKEETINKILNENS